MASDTILLKVTMVLLMAQLHTVQANKVGMDNDTTELGLSPTSGCLCMRVHNTRPIDRHNIEKPDYPTLQHCRTDVDPSRLLVHGFVIDHRLGHAHHPPETVGSNRHRSQ